MTASSSLLTPGALAFIGLANEYCQAAAQAGAATPTEFIDRMLRLLPRLYIAATDLPDPVGAEADIDQAMDEDTYNDAQRSIAALLGENDTYLEVFEQDMKYSDTPIAASISEGLADLLQVMYNFIMTVKDAPEPLILEALEAVKADFGYYWSRILCNVLRALNQVKYNEQPE